MQRTGHVNTGLAHTQALYWTMFLTHILRNFWTPGFMHAFLYAFSFLPLKYSSYSCLPNVFRHVLYPQFLLSLKIVAVIVPNTRFETSSLLFPSTPSCLNERSSSTLVTSCCRFRKPWYFFEKLSAFGSGEYLNTSSRRPLSLTQHFINVHRILESNHREQDRPPLIPAGWP